MKRDQRNASGIRWVISPRWGRSLTVVKQIIAFEDEVLFVPNAEHPRGTNK